MSSGDIVKQILSSEEKQQMLWESAWLCLADLCDAFGDDEKRAVSLESARKYNPDNILTLHQISKVNFKCGRYELACRMFSYITEKHPYDGVAWLGLGHSHLMKDTPVDNHKALEAYQTAMRTLPTMEVIDLWYGIGYLYLKFQSWNQAEKAFAAAFRIAEERLSIAISREERRLSSETALLARLSEIAYRRLHIREMQGLPPDATLLTLIERSPPPGLTMPDAMATVAFGRLQLGDLEGAARVSRAALSEQPIHTPSILRLACALIEMGRHADGQQLLETMLDENDLVAHYILARSYLARGMFQEAHQQFQNSILRPNSNTGEFWVSIACLYYKLEQRREAFEALMYALKLKPTSARVWFNLGVLYEHCGQIVEAEVAYNKALENDPNFDAAKARVCVVSPLVREAERGMIDGEAATLRTPISMPSPSQAQLWEVLSNQHVMTLPNLSEWCTGEDVSVDVLILGGTDLHLPTGSCTPSRSGSKKDGGLSREMSGEEKVGRGSDVKEDLEMK
eukprot:GDKJ01019000.1.p1 GENE.GDKJ01019000.1~~GDKJ01019000.1.p1  ORF type:complete len:512 (+),score=85.61 GDKJ01019000.1:32-1567(+)